MLEKHIKTDKLDTFVYTTRVEMGREAAKAASQAINEVIAKKGSANVIFAAAPSQNEMLEALLSSDVDFGKVNALHMDEYVGLDIGDKQSFAKYLYDHIFSRAPFASVNYIFAKGGTENACESYTHVLEEYPPDVVCMGIGENGHIAFNDPPVADFNDSALVKCVELDPVCRMQQVHDGCFPNIESVPEYAITLTVPALMSATHLVCTVPAKTKANAVRRMLCGEYGEVCPATALRRHPSAKMFLDVDSASMVKEL